VSYRLVKALERRKISDRAAANRFLEEEYLTALNAKFEKSPAQAADLHRVVTPLPLPPPRNVRRDPRTLGETSRGG